MCVPPLVPDTGRLTGNIYQPPEAPGHLQGHDSVLQRSPIPRGGPPSGHTPRPPRSCLKRWTRTKDRRLQLRPDWHLLVKPPRHPHSWAVARHVEPMASTRSRLLCIRQRRFWASQALPLRSFCVHAQQCPPGNHPSPTSSASPQSLPQRPQGSGSDYQPLEASQDATCW